LRGKLHHIYALIGYLLLSLFLTHPLALRMGEAIPGDGFDGWQNYWNLWWVKEALIGLRTSPFYTHLLYHPEGTSLYFHTLNPFNGLLTLPIQQAVGLTASYNSAVLFSFVMGGFGGYLLALWWMRVPRKGAGWPERCGAFLVGVVFTFAPFHFAHLLGHMQVISLEWIPFYALFLLRACKGGELWGGGGLWSWWVFYALPASIFLSLVALCDWYYVLYLVIFSLLYVAYRALVASEAWWRAPLQVGAILAGFGALLSPVLVPMVAQAAGADYLTQPSEEVERLSADLAAFVIPSALHPLWGEAGDHWSQGLTSSFSERTVFAGYLQLALAAFTLLRRLRGYRWWALSLAVFVVLSLGPILHIGGNTIFTPMELQIPLPYAALHRLVPFMHLSRSVSRFDVMVMLSLGMLAGMGLRGLLGEVKSWLRERGRRGAWVVPTAGALAIGWVCFEFLAVPYPMSEVVIHPVYYRLAEDEGDFAILELPMDWDRPEHLLYQTVHGKRLVAGYISRESPDELIKRTPVLQRLRDLRPDVIRQPIRDVAMAVLRRFDVRYAIVHDEMMSPGRRREATLAIVGEMFGGQAPWYQDDDITVYAVSDQGLDAPFVIIGEGWSGWERWEGRTVRWMDPMATLEIYASREEKGRMSFAWVNQGEAVTMEVELNGRPVAEWNLEPGVNPVILDALDLTLGFNMLSFQVDSPGVGIKWEDRRLGVSDVDLTALDRAEVNGG